MSNLFSLVSPRALQFFLCAAIAVLLCVPPLHAALSIGTSYSITLVDIDGNKVSTADGHVSVLVLATTADWEKAREVGDRVPNYCLGNPSYRIITIIRFIRKHGPIVRKIATAVVRRRITEEAKRLQNRYDANKIIRDARQDIFTVTDFDGTVSSQLGEPAEATDFCVFVFGRKGELLAQWHGLPSGKQLAGVLK